MNPEAPKTGNLTGSLLVAHPNLLDPNFRRTILFLSHHNAEEGATGLVLNRPLNKTFGEVLPGKAPAPLKETEIFYGGPVSGDQLTIASLKWQESPASVSFFSFTGKLGESMIEPEWLPGLRGFAGYAGWTKGQLEGEIAQNAWLIVPPTRQLIEMEEPQNAWREIMRSSGPIFKLLAEAPDNPEWN